MRDTPPPADHPPTSSRTFHPLPELAQTVGSVSLFEDTSDNLIVPRLPYTPDMKLPVGCLEAAALCRRGEATWAAAAAAPSLEAAGRSLINSGECFEVTPECSGSRTNSNTISIWSPPPPPPPQHPSPPNLPQSSLANVSLSSHTPASSTESH